ncbi:MAG TPA: protein-glutamate O-methyltransferase CheR [Cytophagales bacterium]|nr:protein-glutamate O-methyltransferase CheR [Cytophagales bacterium]
MEDLTRNQIKELLESLYDRYGYDFRDYNTAHIKRRLTNRMTLSQLSSSEEFRNKVLEEPSFASLLLKDLSIQVTEMFRDPSFYQALRNTVIPLLKTYSFLKIWHAGTASGEEVYSIAIILKEENLYDRCLIYATDFNQQALDKGREGIYSDEKIQENIKNYRLSGGEGSLSDHFVYKYNKIIMNASLRKNIVWANHNLVTDSVFAEANLILCRNVMIYFNKDLQNKVHNLFLQSLSNGGILCLGMKENMEFTEAKDKYMILDKKNKIYKKKYQFSNH